MKYTLILALLIISFTLAAQIHVGGVVDNSDRGGGAPTKQDNLLRNFGSELKMQERNCRSEGSRNLNIDPDFMQIYLSLLVNRTFLISKNKCEEAEIYFKCLYSKAVKEKLSEIKDDSINIIKSLKQEYNLSEKEAKGVLEFFYTLDKDCPTTRNHCEM